MNETIGKMFNIIIRLQEIAGDYYKSLHKEKWENSWYEAFLEKTNKRGEFYKWFENETKEEWFKEVSKEQDIVMKKANTWLDNYNTFFEDDN